MNKLIILITISIILLVGCTQRVIQQRNVELIPYFLATIENDKIVVIFNLEDNESLPVIYKGNLTIQLLNQTRGIIQEVNFNLKNNKNSYYNLSIKPLNLSEVYGSRIIINSSNNKSLNKTSDLFEYNLNDKSFLLKRSLKTIIKYKQKGPAETINHFEKVISDNQDMLIFCLTNNNGEATTDEGNASIIIKDSINNLFTTNFSFTNMDFKEFTFSKGIDYCYKLNVDFNKFNKSLTNIAQASIYISTINNRTINKTVDLFVTNVLSNDERNDYYERLYESNCNKSQHTIIKKGLEVTLVKQGFYKHFDLISNKEVIDYRVDFKIKNDASIGKKSFNVYDALLVINSSQFKADYDSTLKSQNIFAGVTINGYLLFSDIPSNLSGNSIIYAGYYYDDEYNKWEFEFNSYITSER